MDIDAYGAARAESWDRLEELIKLRRLDGDQTDELVRLYQSAAADLATLSSAATDPDIILRLSHIVGRARAKVTGTKGLQARDITRFFTVDLPLALYRIGPLTLIIAACCLAVSVATAVWAYLTPGAMSSLGSEAELRRYAREAFVSYYSNYPAPDFAAQVWTNNARIAVIMVATGITGVLPIVSLGQNFVSVGISAAVMAKYGSLPVFFGLILPHGLLELTSIFVAGAAGLSLFWVLIVPGPRSRAVALAQEGRRLGVVAIGLVIMLGISGLIEGMVTPSNLPGVAKIAIGAAALGLFVVYVVYFGHRAKRAGATGDLAEDEAGYTAPEVG